MRIGWVSASLCVLSALSSSALSSSTDQPLKSLSRHRIHFPVYGSALATPLSPSAPQLQGSLAFAKSIAPQPQMLHPVQNALSSSASRLVRPSARFAANSLFAKTLKAAASSAQSPRRKKSTSAPTTDPDGPQPLLRSKGRHLVVRDKFLSSSTATNLRETFEDRFSEPRSTKTERFVWDYWHVPEQYTLIRTAADQFFPEDQYSSLVDALTQFGQEHLGCNSITQPWLSYYVDGCEQRMHTDSWHGPFAYVLSLTDAEAKAFSGGETFILDKKVLDYWRGFDPAVGLEESKLMTKVDPLFNRLVIFDPRFPHGVRPVRGTQDPLKSRLVLHGWFTDLGTPFYSGGLSEEEATGPINEKLGELYEELGECARFVGVLNVKISVSGAEGKVVKLETVADTLIPDPLDLAEPETEIKSELLMVINKHLSGLVFPTSEKDTVITLPFVFE